MVCWPQDRACNLQYIARCLQIPLLFGVTNPFVAQRADKETDGSVYAAYVHRPQYVVVMCEGFFSCLPTSSLTRDLLVFQRLVQSLQDPIT